MYFYTSPKLFGLAVFASSVSAGRLLSILGQRDPNSTCLSFGIDFRDRGSHFINQNSTEQFKAVTQFEGCNEAYADIWFVQPSGEELTCSTVPTTPRDTNVVTTCPVKKNQLTTGNYSILIFGDNGDGKPFSYERDFQLNVGLQKTVTVTPTITLNATKIPHTVVTSTSIRTVTSTVKATTTYSQPAATAGVTQTISPRPTTTTTTKTITWSLTSYTLSAGLIYETAIASCTVPSRGLFPDPIMTYQPFNFLPAGFKKKHHKRSENAPRIFKRAPDVPTITSTASPAVNVTSTVYGPTVTDTASEIVSQTVYTTLAPSTIKVGTVNAITTLPTPVRTRLQFAYTTAVTTITESFFYTYTRTTTPYAVSTACEQAGGYFLNGFFT